MMAEPALLIIFQRNWLVTAFFIDACFGLRLFVWMLFCILGSVRVEIVETLVFTLLSR